MAIVFNGKEFAQNKFADLSIKAKKLQRKNINPKLFSILVGNNPASELYVNLKKRAGEKIGVDVEIAFFKSKTSKDTLIEFIKKINKDKNTHGIMVQLPLPEYFSLKDRDEIINSISEEKDVDGLRKYSSYVTPTVKAVLYALREGLSYLQNIPSDKSSLVVVVVGSGGFEGGKISSELMKLGYKVRGVGKETENIKKITKTADVLISATGCHGIIGKGMVKDGAIIIDVGSPKGDVLTDDVIKKILFISPVPGGVGPVTISCLLENLLKSASATTGRIAN